MQHVLAKMSIFLFLGRRLEVLLAKTVQLSLEMGLVGKVYILQLIDVPHRNNVRMTRAH
jgi:hypothetical protein